MKKILFLALSGIIISLPVQATQYIQNGNTWGQVGSGIGSGFAEGFRAAYENSIRQQQALELQERERQIQLEILRQQRKLELEMLERQRKMQLELYRMQQEHLRQVNE